MNWALRRRLSNWLFLTVALAPWVWVGAVFIESDWIARNTKELRAQIVDAQTELELERESEPVVSPTRQRLELVKWRLQERPATARTMQLLESLAAESQITVLAIHTPSSGAEGTMLFDVDASGTLHGICTWLQRIETETRLLVVEAGRLFGESGEVRAHVRVGTFHRSELR